MEVAQTVRSFLRKIFVENWQRKLVSLVLAIVVWIVVNHSMSSQKTVHNVSVKVKNLPKGKTIEGIQKDGTLNRKISLTLSGNQNVLENLSGADLQVVINAKNRQKEWIAPITKKNLVNLSSQFDIASSISDISQHNFVVKMSNLISEKIPVLVTKPVGDCPKGYQFLDIWPYHLFLTVEGPEEAVKRLKAKGLKLTFNLDDISASDLESLSQQKADSLSDEVSFPVPSSWKKISVASLSETALFLDDPKAKTLRIDFTKKNLIPIENPIPISLFFPLKFSRSFNPGTTQIKTSSIVEKRNGMFLLTLPLFAKGVPKRFVDIIKDRIEIAIIPSTHQERLFFPWSVQFVFPKDLEDQYVAKVLSEYPEKDLVPQVKEEYLRNRFRKFMSCFQLYTQKEEKLSLDIGFQEDKLIINKGSPS